MRKFLSILLVIAILLAFSACAQGPTGEGADASDDEVIAALEEALTAMSASISPMMSSSGEPSAQSQMKAVPPGKNFSDIFYELMFTEGPEGMEGSEVMQKYTSLFIPDANARVSKIFAETEYGTFSASLPEFYQSGTDATQNITQRSKGLTVSIGEELIIKVDECKIFDRAGESSEPGDTTMTCTGMEYTDTREYSKGPLVRFSFTAESTGKTTQTSMGTIVEMKATLTDLVYKGTPRTVTDAINEAANEFMNYQGGNV